MADCFHGQRTADGRRAIVRVKGRSLPRRLNWRNHSPTGFEWGYNGSGPAQLALAMLGYLFDKEFALEHYQCFKREKIATIDADEWIMDFDEIHAWRRGHMACVFCNNETPAALFDAAADPAKGKK